MSADILELLRAVDPAASMPETATDDRERLRGSIIATPLTSPPRPAGRFARPRLAAVPRRRPVRLALAGAAVAIVAIAAVFGILAALRQAPAAAAVEFRTSGSYIVATVVDPYAAEQQLDAAFAAHGLDITLKLVPVSPSLVGSVVFMDTSAGASAIETLSSSAKQAPGGGPLQIGLRIPVDFKGQAAIDLGRAARPGETYISTGSAFAPGEALYKSGIQGMQVAAAAEVVGKLGLTAEWRDAQNLGAQPQTIPDNWVTDAVPLAPGKVLIFTAAQKPAQQ